MKRTPCRIQTATILALACAALAAPAWAGDEEPTLSEIVEILHERGMIDEDQHTELAAKAAKEDAERSWTDRLSLWGDFRLRYEAFEYERDVYSRVLNALDPSGQSRVHDRHRVRYRGRLNLRGDVNPYATVYFRLVSGDSDPRSPNQTLGSGNDFDTDDVRFDLAYATLTPFADGAVPGVEGGYLGVDLGKVTNPFLWKALPQDVLVWDSDITPEGGSLLIRGGAGPLALFANGGLYIIDENSGDSDPKMAGAQLGATVDLAEAVSFGARGSLYHYFSLDDAFYLRSVLGGNLPDGLGRNGGSIQVVESSAFLGLSMFELVPITIYGSWAQNLRADNSRFFPGEDRQDTAWLAAVFVGDEKQLIELGVGYFHIEANAIVSNFMDSDLADAATNREGWFAEIERQLMEGVNLKLTGYSSERIEGGLAHINSGPRANRLRGRADMIFKF